MKNRFTLFPVMFIVLLLVAGASDVLACSCYAALPAGVEFAESENVIIARLVGFEERGRIVQRTNVFPRYAVDFTVEKVFKGELKISETIKVLDGADEGTCIMGFLRRRPGDKFLFYLGKPGGLGSLEPAL